VAPLLIIFQFLPPLVFLTDFIFQSITASQFSYGPLEFDCSHINILHSLSTQVQIPLAYMQSELTSNRMHHTEIL